MILNHVIGVRFSVAVPSIKFCLIDVKKFFHYYRRIIEFAMKYKWQYIFNHVFTLLWLASLNFSIFKLKDIVNAMSTGEDPMKQVLQLAGIILLPVLFQPLAFLLKAIVYANVTRDLMNQLYTNLMSLDYAFHSNRSTGAVITKILQSENVIATFIFTIEIMVFLNFAAFLFPVFFISIIRPEITLALLATALVLSPLILHGLKINLDKRAKLRDAEYDRNGAVVDGITNYETVRIFGRKSQDLGYVGTLMENVRSMMIAYQRSFRYIDITSRVLGSLLFVVAGLLAVRAYKLGDINSGELIVIITYGITIANTIIEMVLSSREIFKNIPLMDDVFELLDSESDVKESQSPVALKSPKGLVEFKNVVFRYENDKDVINGISMKIKPGETVAFVGPSGGGKSTLVRLILRYFDVASGSIRIDGVDVQDLGVENIGKVIAVVPQEPVLFNRSIKYNIGYAISSSDPEIEKNMDKVINASKKAQIHDFIISLPKGYETVVGERGIKLSGGQKQRIAIARAILKNPKITIFDEATSMLDSESELAIQKGFKELAKNSTTIVIAHRLSTVKEADTIYVIDSGKIVEQGTHLALLKKKGLYAKLWKIQSGGFVKDKK